MPHQMCLQFERIRTVFAMERPVFRMHDDVPFVQAAAHKRLLAHLAFMEFLWIVLGGRVLFQSG